VGLFTDGESILRVSRLRVAYFVLFVLAFLTTEFGRFVYRPIVYRAGANDLGVADTIGNLTGVVTQIFFMVAVLHSNRRQAHRVVLFVVCGYIAYEFLQPHLPKGTFDAKDVLATVIGGLVSVALLALVHRLVGDRETASPGLDTGERAGG